MQSISRNYKGDTLIYVCSNLCIWMCSSVFVCGGRGNNCSNIRCCLTVITSTFLRSSSSSLQRFAIDDVLRIHNLIVIINNGIFKTLTSTNNSSRVPTPSPVVAPTSTTIQYKWSCQRKKRSPGHTTHSSTACSM